MRCDATSFSQPDGWQSRQGNSHRSVVVDETNTARVIGVPTPTKDPPIAHAAVDPAINKLMLVRCSTHSNMALPMAVNIEAATPKAATPNVVTTMAVIQTMATPKAVIDNETMPKAAKKVAYSRST
ncbi:hypothetical protein H257_15774 [Aphanomyces astaci]|uniref:Uncharacterized protein n=1 Tax=Aphanomyces astaci TaxID=112090 RepID=W4FMZ5_APHAT|nr:hypothetical protein H257_15774 [Aphanomyces astaci]ETV68194.1 hypothetical protein H257_15774 [Aphanomyces astaci]|eukprot:XP_009842279.1 hypothetical protein H257_15774 [Aphanomyces astaci]